MTHQITIWHQRVSSYGHVLSSSVVLICHGLRQQMLTQYLRVAPGVHKPNTRIERYNCPVPASNCEDVVQPLGLGLSTSLQRVGDDTVE